MSRSSRILIAIVVVLGAAIGIAMAVYPGKAPVKLAASNCDAELWKHVDERERLPVIEECTAAEGRVISLHQVADGDMDIWLEPDQRSVLNVRNALHGRRHLLVEIVCEHTPGKESGQAACGTYRSHVTIPKPGDRVRVTGAYVTDRDFGWREIHPVTRIEVLR